MVAQAIQCAGPALAKQNQGALGKNLHHQLVPHQRNLGDGPHPSAQRDVTRGFSDKYLEPRVEIGARFDLLEIRIGRGLELFHRDADDVTIRFVRAAADGLHDAGVAARANIEAGFDQQASEPKGFLILSRFRPASRASKNRDAFLQVTAHLISA